MNAFQTLFALGILMVGLCGCSLFKPTELDNEDFEFATRSERGQIILDNSDYSDKRDQRTFLDLVRHFKQKDIPMYGVGRLYTEPAQAQEAYRLKIGDRFIGIYMYDYANRIQRNRLETIKKEGMIYILGNPYVVIVNGGFVFTDVFGHEYQEKIVKALEDFK